jgi:GntR family transcriptional regulator
MSGRFQFCVNPTGPISVYMQIENQVRFAIASGELKSGDPLPSVRDLASMLQVNPNTVTKAYRDLEITGLVGGRRGVGVTVLANAREASRKQTETMVQDHLRDAIAECVAAGLIPSRITKIVSESLKSGRRPYAG